MTLAGATATDRIVKPAVPVIAVALLLYFFVSEDHILLSVALLLLSGGILRAGWTWISRNVVTRWVGWFLAAYTITLLAFVAFGHDISLPSALPFVFLLAVPAFIYDLFFRLPYKGRFARAREERRARTAVPPPTSDEDADSDSNHAQH